MEANSNPKFVVGQYVVVRSGGALRRLALNRVKRVTKRFVELEDGSRWSPDHGGPVPRQSGYMLSWMHALDEENLASLREYLTLDYFSGLVSALQEPFRKERGKESRKNEEGALDVITEMMNAARGKHAYAIKWGAAMDKLDELSVELSKPKKP